MCVLHDDVIHVSAVHSVELIHITTLNVPQFTDSNDAVRQRVHSLQDWQTATDIRIVFSRLFATSAATSAAAGSPPPEGAGGDHSEASGDAYYYSLADLAVGGRCKCNGHASRCVELQSPTLPGAGGGGDNLGSSTVSRLVCDCRHNTDGDDCERCRPFYYDRPWARASLTKVNECVGERVC